MVKVVIPVEVTGVPGTTATPTGVAIPAGRIVSVQPQQLPVAGGGAGTWSTRFFLQVCILPTTGNAIAQQSCLWSGYIRNGCLGPSTPNLEAVNGQAIQLQFTASGNAPAAQSVRVNVTIETDLKQPPGGTFYYFERPGEGAGSLLTIALGDPAAGANYADQVVPAVTQWRLKAFRGTLVAAVAVASRLLDLRVLDAAANVLSSTSQSGAITASQTFVVIMAQGLGFVPATSGGQVWMPGLDVVATAGFTVRFTTIGIQGLDDWGTGVLQVEEWAIP